ncbi:MAG TPA: dihydroneopterin aldolase, partial [Clostridia bacterium]|nr:dihydroneopterin aldolase [Clostridia bacterium]
PHTMSLISIVDLEVFYSVGVTDQERAQPQRLHLTVHLTVDFTSAALSDRIEKTINYHQIVTDLLKFGENRSWKLIEKLAVNIADTLFATYHPQAVQVEVKKFIIPQARYVSVTYAKDHR